MNETPDETQKEEDKISIISLSPTKKLSERKRNSSPNSSLCLSKKGRSHIKFELNESIEKKDRHRHHKYKVIKQYNHAFQNDNFVENFDNDKTENVCCSGTCVVY